MPMIPSISAVNLSRIRVCVFASVWILLSFSTLLAQEQSPKQIKKQIKKQMKFAYKPHKALLKSPDVSWQTGMYYAGVLALYEATQKKKYFRALLKVGFETQWATGSRLRQPETHLIAQPYLDMHRFSGSNSMFFVYQLAVDSLLPRMNRLEIRQSRQLFFAPPALAKLSGITQGEVYLNFTKATWHPAKQSLYDPEKRLWRASTAQAKRYDGLSNAWALAGLVRMWDELPYEDSLRVEVDKLGKDIAEVFRYLQQPKGLWPTDFSSPTGQGQGDTLATTILCYALAAGVNQGLLEAELYRTHILLSWEAIMHRQTWAAEEAGMYLLAGNEIIRLLE